jgi:hypothetical protein
VSAREASTAPPAKESRTKSDFSLVPERAAFPTTTAAVRITAVAVQTTMAKPLVRP